MLLVCMVQLMPQPFPSFLALLKARMINLSGICFSNIIVPEKRPLDKIVVVFAR